MRAKKLISSYIVGAIAALLLAGGANNAAADEKAAQKFEPGFSFAVYGDSRSMMYLPSKSDQKEEATKLLVDMFELVLPEKVAAEVVKKDV